MNRTKKIKNILQKHFFDVGIKIQDNSHLHKGHKNFKGKGEAHICVNLIINSKSKTRKVVPLLEKLINSKSNFRFSRCRHARKKLHVTTQRGAEST